MKVTVNFGSVRVIVPCGNGELLVRDLIDLAVVRYKKATGKPRDAWVTVHNLKSFNDGGILDPDDHLNDVVDDREQIIALYEEQTSPFPPHHGGDGTSASSAGTASPEIFQCTEINHNHSGKGGCNCTDVEITGDRIPSGVTPLQVRRGSEPALNRLSPVSNDPNPTKRWSAAVIVDDIDVPAKTKHDSIDQSDDEPPPGERGEGSGEEKSTLSRISRGSGRLSILGNNPNMYRWAEAADRQLFKLQDSRREPLGGTGASPDRDRDSEISGASDDRETVIVLKNEAGPLGIHVVPDHDMNGRDMGLVIQGIEPGGRIDRDGRLHAGQRIIEVNGQSLLHVSFKRAQEIFKDALQSPEIVLRLARSLNHPGIYPLPPKHPPPPPPPFTKQVDKDGILVEGEERGNLNTKVATVTPTKKLPPNVPGRSQQGPALNVANTRKIGKKIYINLTKGSDGLGFSITTRDNPAGGNCPIYIKNILPKGAAIQDGRLRPGDRLLEVNSIEMTGKSQNEAVSTLRTVPPGGVVELVVSRQELDPSPSPGLPRELPPEQHGDEVGIFPWRHREVLMFDIPLNDTGSAGLGVSVKGKTASTPNGPVDLGIFVKSVIHGGAASKDGRLLTNDQLININGISLLGTTNTRAMETLRRAMTQVEGPNPDAITLTIARRIPSPNGTESNNSSEEFLSTSGSGDSVHLRGDSLLSSDSGGASFENLSFSNSNSKLSNGTPDNSASENSENTVIFMPKQEDLSNSSQNNLSGGSLPGGRNPVIDRLMGQGGTLDSKAGVRNESYLRASHESWGGAQLQQMIYGRTKGHPVFSPNSTRSSSDAVIIDEDYTGEDGQQRGKNKGSGILVSPVREKPEIVEPPSPACDANGNDLNISQLSLNEDGTGFCRDGFGRQSMSEKRHAQLDARNTDTYKRNKRAREKEEQEKLQTEQSQKQQVDRRTGMNSQQVSTTTLIRSNSADSLISHSKSNLPHPELMANGGSPETDVSGPTIKDSQFGPSLGMRKSSSLESLQTMVQELQKDEVMAGGSSNLSTKVSRSRGCNESFRAAVDRSYEGPVTEQMETLEEERESESGSSVGPANTENRIQSSIPGVRPVPVTLEPSQDPLKKDLKSVPAKKKGLLKGIGSVFRFGKNRKTVPEPGSKLSRDELEQEAEKIRARRAAQEEQERIQEQYRKFMEQQRLQSHSQNHKDDNYAPANHPAHSPQSISQNSQNGQTSRHERMQQLRAQHQKKHQERQGHYPKDDLEEWYEQEMKDKVPPRGQRHDSEIVHSRSHSFDIFKEMERPGSRVGLVDPSQYSHYVNFNEIQQHIRQFQQKQQQSPHHTGNNMKQPNQHPGKLIQMPQANHIQPPHQTNHIAQHQKYNVHQKHPTPPMPHQRLKSIPIPSSNRVDRPASNYFEYESVHSSQHLQSHQTPHLKHAETNSSSLPRHAHVAGHRMVYAKTPPQYPPQIKPPNKVPRGIPHPTDSKDKHHPNSKSKQGYNNSGPPHIFSQMNYQSSSSTLPHPPTRGESNLPGSKV